MTEPREKRGHSLSPQRGVVSTTDHARKMLAEATPGPWEWHGIGDHGYPQRVTGNDDGLVLVAETYEGHLDRPAPNVALIAAAPTLLAAALDVIEAAKGFADHASSNEDHGSDADYGEPWSDDLPALCMECGEEWPCFVERLHIALDAWDAIGGGECEGES